MAEYAFPDLNPHQSRSHEPTQWQLDLAAAIEGIFATGAHSLDELVAGLNASRVRPLGGGSWTPENYIALMRELGA
jgi:hypothetical protein